MQEETAKFGKVDRASVDTTLHLLESMLVQTPGAAELHAQRGPDVLLKEGGDRHACYSLKDHPEQQGVVVVVMERFTRRADNTGIIQGQHTQIRVILGLGIIAVYKGKFGVLDPRRHLQQVTDSDRSESRVTRRQFGQVIRDRVIHAVDESALDRDPDQCGGKGFGDRKRGQDRLAAGAVEIMLVKDLVILNDDKGLGAVFCQEGIKVIDGRSRLKLRPNALFIQGKGEFKTRDRSF